MKNVRFYFQKLKLKLKLSSTHPHVDPKRSLRRHEMNPYESWCLIQFLWRDILYKMSRFNLGFKSYIFKYMFNVSRTRSWKSRQFCLSGKCILLLWFLLPDILIRHQIFCRLQLKNHINKNQHKNRCFSLSHFSLFFFLWFYWSVATRSQPRPSFPCNDWSLHSSSCLHSLVCSLFWFGLVNSFEGLEWWW